MRFNDLVPNTMRRRALLSCLFFAAGTATRTFAQPQSPPTLRPGESIDVPGGKITVLGVDINRGSTTSIVLRMRALADVQHTLGIYSDTFRVLAADVPRAPAYLSTSDGQTSSFLVAKDSAVDFSCTFKLLDKTDDLVLQVRVDGSVERRRLSAR
jgi:hypothetical protein